MRSMHNRERSRFRPMKSDCSASLKLVNDYYDLFAKTVPQEEFDDLEASLIVYALAQEDALKTFKSLDAPSEFMQVMYDQTMAAWDTGLGEKQLTALAASMADG